jgi:hypothetical protein
VGSALVFADLLGVVTVMILESVGVIDVFPRIGWWNQASKNRDGKY